MQATEPKIGVYLRAFNWQMQTRRKARGLTQTDLGLLVGVNQSVITGIETFKKLPSFELMQEIADALDAPVNDIFPEEVLALARRKVATSVQFAIPASVFERLPQHARQSLPTPDESYTNLDLRQSLLDSMSDLSDRERAILVLRTGMLDGEQYTLAETAQRTGMNTIERVRQVERKALRKMRHPKRGERLKVFLDG